MKVIGILTGDPELGNFLSKIGKRLDYFPNWTVRLNDAVIYFLQNHQKKYKIVKISPDMLDDDLFKKIDFMFYNFLDPVAAKILSVKTFEMIISIINKHPSKVFPPPKFANLIVDKCKYYTFLEKSQIPVVPFFCLDRNYFLQQTQNAQDDKVKSFVRNLYKEIQDYGWKGFIGKPILGTSSKGFKLYPDFNNQNISIHEVYKQMAIHLKKVFLTYDFPKLMFQEKHAEFGTGLRPELKLYYIGTRFVFGWITWDNQYYLLGKGPKNTKFYLSPQNVKDAKRFSAKVLKVIKPLFQGSPLLVTRIDIGCCLDHTHNKFNAKNFFLNEIEFGPAYILARIPGRFKMYMEQKIGKQMMAILNHKFKSKLASVKN